MGNNLEDMRSQLEKFAAAAMEQIGSGDIDDMNTDDIISQSLGIAQDMFGFSGLFPGMDGIENMPKSLDELMSVIDRTELDGETKELLREDAEYLMRSFGDEAFGDDEDYDDEDHEDDDIQREAANEKSSLDKLLDKYSPEPPNRADRLFIDRMKNWIKTEAAKVKEDVRVFKVYYELSFKNSEDHAPTMDGPELNYCTADEFGSAEEKWNLAFWDGYCEEVFDREMFREWLTAKRFDVAEDDEEVSERIFDLAVIAVSELHAEKFTENLFGKKIPFIIGALEGYYMVAVRAAKANGREMFDEEFFSDVCGVDKW